MNIFSPQYGLSENSHAGGEVYDYTTLSGLARLGHKIVVLVPYGNEIGARPENVTVYKLPLPYIHVSYLFNFWVLFYSVILNREYHFDLIRVHSPYLTGVGALIYKYIFNRRMKVVAVYHHLEERFIWKIIDHLFMNSYNKIITGSEYSKGTLVEFGPACESKIEVIYHGVSQPKEAVTYKPQERVKSLVYCGGLIKRKNVGFLLDVIKKLGDETVLYIVGDGPERQSLEDKAAKEGISKRVTFCGGLSEEEKNKIYDRSRLFVFPSLNEGFGLAPVEAMSRSLPVISSSVGALLEIVGCGGVCLDLDVDLWVKKINDVLNDPKVLSKMSDLSQDRSADFRWSTAVQRLEAVFTSVLK